MNRRSFVRSAGAGAGLGAFLMGVTRGDERQSRGRKFIRAALPAIAEAAVDSNARGTKPLTITKVRCILTQPGGARLAVVKVETSEPGLYGLGCATFTQRITLVKHAVEDYLDPFLRGKDPLHIQDNWQAIYQSSYWRNGPVLMNALAGVDGALWDILGKRAGMPVYQLLGGRTRATIPAYGSTSGASEKDVAPDIERMLSEGYKHIRVQTSIPGHFAYGGKLGGGEKKAGHFTGNYFDPALYLERTPRLFADVRRRYGEQLELLHDVHERLPPILAIRLAKALDPLRLFFLEDPFAPEDIGYFPQLRGQTSIPIAMGELFNNPNEWVDLVSKRLIDFIRCHISQIGGISAAVKLANFCDFFRVRTAWHGPGDCSPVGHAANGHVAVASSNFGVQEFSRADDKLREVFPGAPGFKDGGMILNEAPGIGVDLDEKAAAKYPITTNPPFDMEWGRLRGPDGQILRP